MPGGDSQISHIACFYNTFVVVCRPVVMRICQYSIVFSMCLLFFMCVIEAVRRYDSRSWVPVDLAFRWRRMLKSRLDTELRTRERIA